MSRPPPPRHNPSRPGGTRPVKPRGWSRPLADLVGGAIDPVLARQGFSEAELILNWEDIAGERLAANSRPIRMQWPARPPGGTAAPGGAALLVRVEGAFAIEMQHLADQIVARVNAHLGWRCVGRLLLRQGPLAAMPDEPGEAQRRRPPAPAAVAAAEVEAAGVEDEALRAALVRLGSNVLTRPR